jgi:hypothetical protein
MNTHSWQGTERCLRLAETNVTNDIEGMCVNDHTGCLWNDGHNVCMHPAILPKLQKHDSPLLKHEESCLRCKKVGYNYRKLGPEYVCQDCWWTLKTKYG